MMRYIALIFVCTVLSGCMKEDESSSINPGTSPEIGRYQIFEKDGRTFLLDTIEGDSWRFVYINATSDDKKIDPVDWVWSPVLRFPDRKTIETYMSIIQKPHIDKNTSIDGE